MTVGIRQTEVRSAMIGTARLRALRTGMKARRRVSAFWAVAPLFLLDAVCIVLGMAAAYHLRFHLMAYNATFSKAFYIRLALVAIPMWLPIFAIQRLYHQDHLFGGRQEYINVVNACTAGLVGLIIYSFLDRKVEHDISRGWLALTWFLSIASVSLARLGYRQVIYYLRRRGVFVQRALVVGANEEGQAVVTQLHGSPNAGVEPVGFVDPTLPSGTEVEGLPVLGTPSKLGTLIQRLGVDELIVIPTALRREELLNIYRDWGTDERVRICLSSGLYELFTNGAQVREVGFVPLVSLNRTRITGLNELMKTTLDYIGALVGVTLLSPLFALVSFLIRRDSPGPAIYRRRVVGLHGHEFDAYKFRTMIPNAEAYLEAHPELKEEWDRNGKIENDPRITRVGNFLRRYSLDELPQLFNVLKGQMSLVGPRMLTPAELNHFGRWQHNLLTVKPGLTGLWQVSGRSDLSYADRVQLDMQYIRNYTVWSDLKVLFGTIQAVLQGRGAY